MTDLGSDSRGVEAAYAADGDHCQLFRDAEDNAMLVNICDDVEGFLDRNGVDPADIDAVVVTDYDVDRADQLDALADAADGLTVYVPDVSARELRQEQSRLESEREEMRPEDGRRSQSGHGPGLGHGTGSARGPDDEGAPVPDEERREITEELERLQRTAENKDRLNETLDRRDVDVTPVHEDEPGDLAAPLEGYEVGVLAPPSHAVRDVLDARITRLAAYVTDAPESDRGGFDLLVTGGIDHEEASFVRASFDLHYNDDSDPDDRRKAFDPDVVTAPPPGPGEDVSPLVADGEPSVLVYAGERSPSPDEVAAARAAGAERVLDPGEGEDATVVHEVTARTGASGPTPERVEGADEQGGLVDDLDDEEVEETGGEEAADEDVPDEAAGAGEEGDTEERGGASR